jgi:hypothetical protein
MKVIFRVESVNGGRKTSSINGMDISEVLVIRAARRKKIVTYISMFSMEIIKKNE